MSMPGLRFGCVVIVCFGSANQSIDPGTAGKMNDPATQSTNRIRRTRPVYLVGIWTTLQIALLRFGLFFLNHAMDGISAEPYLGVGRFIHLDQDAIITGLDHFADDSTDRLDLVALFQLREHPFALAL